MPTKVTHDVLYFDFETDDKYGPYAALNLIGYALNDEPAKTVHFGKGEPEEEEFRKLLADDSIRKVGYNIVNFDFQVAIAHDFKIAGPVDDLYLMAKTLYPDHPAYTMKLICLT